MPSARHAILTVAGIAVLSLLYMVYAMLQPPDRDGMGDDSFGTHQYGHRAIFETMHNLNIPVRRLLTTPTPRDGDPVSIVLWGPSPQLVSRQPEFLEHLVRWANRGGRIVVAPALEVSGPQSYPDLLADLRRSTPDVLKALDLQGVRIASADARTGRSGVGLRNRSRPFGESFESDLEGLVKGRPAPLHLQRLATRGEGSLGPLADRARGLALPADGVNVLSIGESVQPAGVFYVVSEQGDDLAVAAEFTVGQGSIVVLSDPRLLANALVGQEDNGVLAVDLLAQEGREVAFDEFYHGLTIQGNPFWLLTRVEFAAAAFGVSLACGIFLWRGGVFLGPPGEAAVASRRTIAEYVDAMGRFFARSRGHRPFILREVRDGVLRMLAGRLGTRAGHDQVDVLAKAIERRDPRAAQQLRSAVEHVDRAIGKGPRLNEHDLVLALKRILSCL